VGGGGIHSTIELKSLGLTGGGGGLSAKRIVNLFGIGDDSSQKFTDLLAEQHDGQWLTPKCGIRQTDRALP
jgi:hypothetical protein